MDCFCHSDFKGNYFLIEWTCQVSFFVGAVNIPCHQEEATAKLVFNCSNHGQGDLEITKNTILDSSSARASVGDSANSFDFGMAGSGQLTGPCMLAAENHEQNTAGQSDFPTNQPEKAANQQDSCTANSACLQNLQVLPDHDKSYNSQADQLTSGGTQPGQDETSPNGTPSNTWINAECRTMSKSPQNRAAKSPMSTLSWFSPSNTPPGAHQLSSVQHVSEHNAGEKQAVFTSPGSACGKQSQILPTGSGPEVSSHQRPMAAGVVFCSSRDTSDGIEGKMANKGSYAAAAEGARVRAVKGRQERERLAMELAKRRADVASRKAAEDKQKAGDKGPRGHHVRCTSRSTKYAAGNIQQEVAAGAFHKLAKLPGHGVASVLQSCRQDATTVNGQSTSSIGAQPEKTRPVQKQRRWKQSNGRINSWGQEDSSNVKSRQVHLACDAQQLYSDLSNILDGDSTDEDTELPEDWEIQLLKPNSEKQAKIPSQPSNFARSPLAAALLQLVGLPGMHGMDPLTRAVSGRIAKGHQVDVCTGLSIEEEALLNSLRRIDPNLLRKSLKVRPVSH